MCGRYSLTPTAEDISRVFRLKAVPELAPRFNIAPSQSVPVVREHKGERRLDLLHWGLVPSFTKDLAAAKKPINARSESMGTRMYKTSFAKRRCLVPADGFYEWQKTEDGKQPFYFRMNDGKPFAFAGLWEYWKDDAHEPIVSFTILTTEPNEVARPIHNRMPVIIPPEQYDAWLDPANDDAASLKAMLVPYSADRMTAYPVSRVVNAPANDTPECIRPVKVDPPKSLFGA